MRTILVFGIVVVTDYILVSMYMLCPDDIVFRCFGRNVFVTGMAIPWFLVLAIGLLWSKVLKRTDFFKRTPLFWPILCASLLGCLAPFVYFVIFMTYFMEGS